jgi:Protein of unknown function (DUF1552)
MSPQAEKLLRRPVMRRPVMRRPIMRRAINRRAFLYGLGGVGIGLPFLESSPERSAWAQDEEPVFVLFMGTGNGIIADEFWPSATGPLTELATEANATGILADFAEQLLFVRGLRYPLGPNSDTHGQSYPQMLTGAPYQSTVRTGALCHASAASIDVILAPLLNPGGAEPLTLYSGMKQGYIDEAMSWTADGNVRPAEGNPFVIYARLIGAAGQPTEPGILTDAVLVRRQSAIDLARDELLSFQGRTNISQNDSLRLEQHLDALRVLERNLGEVNTAGCSIAALDVAGITAANETFRTNGMVEVVSKLQLELAAFAFACNLSRVATLQSGDGLDSTRYDVPNGRGWTFHQISHQVQSDGTTGNDPIAALAHAEIDRLRMETLAHGISKFDGHGLLDKALLLWTSQFSDGRSGSSADLPHILAGNPYGRLKSGQFVKCNSQHNSELLTTIAQVVGVDVLIGTAERGLDDLLA